MEDKNIEHICIRCKNKFINLFDLKRHLNRKKKCISDDPNFSLTDEQVIKKSIHQVKKTTKKTTIDIALEKRKEICLTCKHCDKVYPNNSRLKQHMTTCKMRHIKKESNLKICKVDVNELYLNINEDYELEKNEENEEEDGEEEEDDEDDDEDDKNDVYKNKNISDIDDIIDFSEPFNQFNFPRETIYNCILNYDLHKILEELLINSYYINVFPIDRKISYVHYNGNCLMSNTLVVEETVRKILNLKETTLKFYKTVCKIPDEIADVLFLSIKDMRNKLNNNTFLKNEDYKKIIDQYKNSLKKHKLIHLKKHYNIYSKEYNFIKNKKLLRDYLVNNSPPEIIERIDNKDNTEINSVKMNYDDGKLKIKGLWELAEKKILEEKQEKIQNKKILVV